MGRPKAWLPFGDETLLERVARLVSRDTSPVVLVASKNQTLPPLPKEVILVRDAEAGRGPIQGLATGLGVFPSSVELVYVTAVDAPWLASGWIVRLVETLGEHDAAVPWIEGRLHPLSALYRREPALRAARAGLLEDRPRVVEMCDRLRPRRVEADELINLDPEFLTIRNLNTPDDYRLALERVSRTLESPEVAP